LKWAIDLQARERGGERLSAYQRDAYRRALGVPPAADS
jgi:hypothetical protein